MVRETVEELAVEAAAQALEDEEARTDGMHKRCVRVLYDSVFSLGCGVYSLGVYSLTMDDGTAALLHYRAAAFSSTCHAAVGQNPP